MASVEHLELPDGSEAIGVERDGVFVPFVTLSGARVAQLLENSTNRGLKLKKSGGRGKAATDDKEGK